MCVSVFVCVCLHGCAMVLMGQRAAGGNWFFLSTVGSRNETQVSQLMNDLASLCILFFVIESINEH